MKFLQTFVGSLIKKSFYKDVESGKTDKGFFYVFQISLIFSLIITAILSLAIYILLPHAERVARSAFPAGTEITIKDGFLTTNVNPVVIPNIFDKKYRHTASSSVSGEVENLLVIDVTASSTAVDIALRNTKMLITSKDYIYKVDVEGKDSQTYVTGTLSDLVGRSEEIVFDQDGFMQFVGGMKKYAKFMPFIIFVGALAGIYLGSLFISLIYAIFIFVMYRINKNPQNFTISYRVSLYSTTFRSVLVILGAIIPIFAMSWVSIPITLLFIAYMIK